MITTIVRRIVPLVAVGAVMVFAVRNQQLPEVRSDTWFHLRIGAEFLNGWSIADPGHLSPYDTAEWLPTQWLSQLGMVWLEQAGGPAALIWVTGTVSVVLVALIYTTCQRVSSPLPAAIATAVCFLGVAPGMSARPQILSYLLLALTLRAWLATVEDLRPRWWLVPLTWAWAPLHGMWPTGILLGVAVVAGLALGRQAPASVLARLSAVPVLSALVVLLTPIHVGIYSSLLTVGERSSYFAEWGPPDFRAPDAAAVVVMAAAVVLVGLTRARLAPTDIAILGLAIVWALYSIRTGAVAAIMLAPLLAAAVQQFVPSVTPARRAELGLLVLMATACSAGLGLVAPGRADSEVVPRWLDTRLEALPAGTRLLNDWDIGPWFLWRHPELFLVSHGYGDVFTEDELDRNADILRVQPGWREDVDELDVDYALVRVETALEYALEGDGWRVVEDDEDYALLRPPQS